MNANKRKHLLILGGGFGGMYAAIELDRALAYHTDVEITLVNRQNFFLFTPMLHEVAASDLDITHIVNPIRKLLRRATFLHGEVETIDLASKRVAVFHGPNQHHHELSYDYLLIALGATTNFYKIPGLEERALTMKSLGDAIHLRNRLIDLLEEADFDCAFDSRADLLTVVVAGGGFAGVETVAAANDFLREATRFYRNLDENDIRLVLVHPGPVVLPKLGEQMGLYAQKKLGERRVEILVNTKVKAISDESVELSDGTKIRTKTLVWTAGTSPNPVLETLPCKKELSTTSHEQTFEPRSALLRGCGAEHKFPAIAASVILAGVFLLAALSHWHRKTLERWQDLRVFHESRYSLPNFERLFGGCDGNILQSVLDFRACLAPRGDSCRIHNDRRLSYRGSRSGNEHVE